MKKEKRVGGKEGWNGGGSERRKEGSEGSEESEGSEGSEGRRTDKKVER